jgi:glycerophosphodiester phosphodiesterase
VIFKANFQLDVQVTKDGVPVIYHDFQVSEHSKNPTIYELTLKEFLQIGKREAAGKEIEPHESCIEKQPFCTLADVLVKIPCHIGLDIELKYPSLEELDATEPKLLENQFPLIDDHVQAVLNLVLQRDSKEGEKEVRKILFSSFHPEICLSLRKKQSIFPIGFLSFTRHHSTRMPLKDTAVSDPSIVRADSIVRDWRSVSIENNCQFVVQEGLEALILDASSLLQYEDRNLESFIQDCHQHPKHGFLLMTYGAENSNPLLARRQILAGLDALISDHVTCIQ